MKYKNLNICRNIFFFFSVGFFNMDFVNLESYLRDFVYEYKLNNIVSHTFDRDLIRGVFICLSSFINKIVYFVCISKLWLNFERLIRMKLDVCFEVVCMNWIINFLRVWVIF